MLKLLFSFAILVTTCTNSSIAEPDLYTKNEDITTVQTKYKEDSWEYFLQHLPLANEPILNYRGEAIADQAKHVAVIKYDVGKKDLQQCADVLMRLRAEYLFQQKRFKEIGFHFTSGHSYTWAMYNKGLRPVVKGNNVSFKTISPSGETHASLRSYLDVVYTYANTVSLSKELKPATGFAIGTVIIQPGFPGHTCIIIDELKNDKGETLYKLAEGFMPAQSMYVLSNPNNNNDPWYRLHKGTLRTSSFIFDFYLLRKFE